ncbi:CWF19-like protein 1 homolog [Contarinia nasturtii]|uniref:CWF19-like protein 1 homolog n=1 Tax=Contarinia nasturtii TaxID=265458 RepID=UPI0012D47ABA|nr:CWF19-like protein 1 homolog [Contarinia nasturtii]
MDGKHKILVCGDVRGNFKVLFNKIQNINQKSGPFDLLLCVGDFFGSDNSKLEAYKNGNLKITVPTYVLGPNTSDHSKYYEDLNDGEICPNLTYLGRRGLYTVSTGLKIAYVSGIESKDADPNSISNFKIEDVKSVANACLASNNTSGDYRGIDILISSQWPNGPQKDQSNTSELLAWLSSEIKPRYHFCGLNDAYFEPAPYRNVARPNNQFSLSTRFIALASVGNPSKSKFIYALNVTAVDKMRVTDLIQKTTNEIPCPYDSMKFTIEGVKTEGSAQGNQYFYDFNNTDDHQRKRQRYNQHDHQQKRPRQPNFDQEKCWFCLSSPSVEKHLVVTIGDSFYLALAKGPINQYHILILSVTHIQSVALLSEDDWNELDKFKTALRKFFASKNQEVVFFERNYKSGHLHINVCSVDKSIAWKIKNSFEDKAEEYNLTLETIPKLTAPTQLPDRGAYFVAELPDETTMLCRQMKQFPINFGREAVLLAEESGDDKTNWRDCLVSKETEIEYVKCFRNEFKPFDFTT